MSSRLFAVVVVALLCVGCTGNVPPGYVGRLKTVSGFGDELLQPGRHSAYGRDELWIAETRDQTAVVSLSVLLEKDQVNLDVEVSITYTLKNDKETVLPLFNKVSPKGEERRISLDQVFKVYAARVLNSTPRDSIRQKTVEQILGGVKVLEDEIESAVVEELSSSPLRVIGLSLTNFDFPEFITQAQEAAKKQEVEIRQAESAAKKMIVELENAKKAAVLESDIELIEAKRIADANRLIGESLMGDTGDRYLRWHEIRVYGEAATGPNNTIFLPMNILAGGGGMDVGATLLETPVRKVADEAFGSVPGSAVEVAPK